MKLKNKQVLVMGLGLHGGGVGVTKYLVQKGAKVTVTDLKNKKDLSASLEKLAGLPIKYTLGQHRFADFENTDLIIKNPGVANDSPYLTLANKRAIPVLMDINLFWQDCPHQKIIGITGTKGKTTTAHLVERVIKQAGLKTVLAGNLGVSFLEVLPKIDLNTWAILELSSWQLEGLSQEGSCPHISVITNIFPDHLNRYQNMAAYVAAKKAIFTNQKKTDYLILNQTDSWSQKLADQAPGKTIFFSKKDVPENWQEKIKLIGNHNLDNIAAAIKVGQTLKIDKESIKKAIFSFSGLPHRLEFVDSIGEVDFYNDSAATNPAAACAAITSFEKPLVWILGGADKKLQFNKLIETASKQKQIRAFIFLKGDATEKIQPKIKKILPQTTCRGPFDNFNQAVTTAKKIAQKGDVVILSPGAASFGMFKNEFDRGNQFKKIVNELAKNHQNN